MRGTFELSTHLIYMEDKTCSISKLATTKSTHPYRHHLLPTQRTKTMERELNEGSFFQHSVISDFKHAFSLSSDQIRAATPPGTITISGETRTSSNNTWANFELLCSQHLSLSFQIYSKIYSLCDVQHVPYQKMRMGKWLEVVN